MLKVSVLLIQSHNAELVDGSSRITVGKNYIFGEYEIHIASINNLYFSFHIFRVVQDYSISLRANIPQSSYVPTLSTCRPAHRHTAITDYTAFANFHRRLDLVHTTKCPIDFPVAARPDGGSRVSSSYLRTNPRSMLISQHGS